MNVRFLATKFHIPPWHTGGVSRPNLLERISAGLTECCKLTLISAPAGYGKTTLTVEWIQSITGKTQVAWLSLDEADNDPTRFLGYLITAFQRVDESIGQNALSLLNLPQLSQFQPIMDELLNDITIHSGSIALVLDDYHVITNPKVHRALEYFLEHQPICVQLIITTREDPPFPLARLRSREQLVEIRARDLRFTAKETRQFFSQSMKLDLPDETIRTLEARTEGWVVGLQLAALSLQSITDQDQFVQSFAGSDRYILDYLLDEVLERQPVEMQDFLLRTSVLDRFCAPLCDTLRGDSFGAQSSSTILLEMIEHANLFLIPLDNQRKWYRYHHLFADLLRYRLQSEHPELASELHRRASQWYQKSSFISEAFFHALAVPDYILAADLAEQQVLSMVGGSQITTYLEWIRAIPDSVIFTRPYLCAGAGWAYSLTWQPEAAEQFVQAGEAALPRYKSLFADPENRFITQDEVRGHLTAIQAHCARIRGDFRAAIEYCQQALTELPPNVYTVRCIVSLILGQLRHLDYGELETARPALIDAYQMAHKSGENSYAAVYALGLLGNIDVVEGRLHEAEVRCTQAIELGSKRPGARFPIPASCRAYFGLASIYYLRNDLGTTASFLQKGLTLAKQAGNRETLMDVYLLQAKLALVAGDLTEAQLMADQADQLLQRSDIPCQFPGQWVAFQVRLCLARKDAVAATHWLENCGIKIQGSITNPDSLPAHLWEYLALARVLFTQHRLDEALVLLKKVVRLASSLHHTLVALEARLLQAMAYHSLGNNNRAFDLLEETFAQAVPEGILRPYLDLGTPLAKLLRLAFHKETQTDNAQKLCALLAMDTSSEITIKPLDPPLVFGLTPLTNRERRILNMLASGISSTEIAAELVIGVSTARTHIKHLYRKLNVHSREEAIAAGQKLEIL